MKKNYGRFIFLLLLVSSNISAHAQIITNGGFESWETDSDGYLAPVSWWTSNGMETNISTTIQAPGRTGDYSVKFVSVDTGGGFACGSLFYFYAGNLRPVMLSGFWKGTYSTNEGMYASVWVVDQYFDLVAVGDLYDSIAHPDWVQFHDSVIYMTSGDAIETWVQLFLFGNSSSAIGYVDDVTLTYLTDVGEIKTMNLFNSALANYACGNFSLSFDLRKSCNLEISLYSMDGKILSASQQRLESGHHEWPVSLMNYSEGIYFCRITGEGINQTYKLVR
jgi:hypothetical protein